MESEQVSSCCSSSSPSPSPALPLPAEDAACRTELEAAEALADLAQRAIMREMVVESAAKWGSKGKRVRKRIKSESPPCDSVLKPADSEPPAPDLAEGQTVQEEQEAPAVSRDLTTVPVKAEVDDDEAPKQLVASSLRSRSNDGVRSRQKLSEAEREERRIRRILANRESARRTIRRRQALCEELNRKASDLSYVNLQLKREKDSALKEFQSLETINKHLKEQLSRTVTPEGKEPEEASKAGRVEMSTSTPIYFYNPHPFQLFCWPSNSPVLPRNGFTVTPATSIGGSVKVPPAREQEKPANDDGSKSPFFVMPYPLFLPHPDQSNGVHAVVPYGGTKHAQEGCSSDGDKSPARPGDEVLTLRTHTLSKTEGDHYDLNESAAMEIPSEGGGTSGPASGHRRGIPSLHEKKRGSVGYSSKRLVDAAEARKRRKELTRLKNLHGRQCRMEV